MMILVRNLFALLLLTTTTASAEEASDYRGALLKCNPSCYEKWRLEGRAKPVKLCAYLPIHFTQDRIGRGWGALERGSATTAVSVPSCKFPSTVPAKWRAVVAQAKKQIPLAKGEFLTVAADEEWGYEKDALGRVTTRSIMVIHYSRDHEEYDGCGQGDPRAVCEGFNNEVTSFNKATYRLAEAKRLKKDGSEKECRIASWGAVDHAVEARKQREYETGTGNWKTKTYATRYNGLLSEKEMFAKNDEIEAEARALWTACGGKGTVPL